MGKREDPGSRVSLPKCLWVAGICPKASMEAATLSSQVGRNHRYDHEGVRSPRVTIWNVY